MLPSCKVKVYGCRENSEQKLANKDYHFPLCLYTFTVHVRSVVFKNFLFIYIFFLLLDPAN